MHKLLFAAAATAYLCAAPVQAFMIDDYSVGDSIVSVVTGGTPSGTEELGNVINIGAFDRQLMVNGFNEVGAVVVIDASTRRATFNATALNNGMAGSIMYTPVGGTIDLSGAGVTLDFVFDGALNSTFYDVGVTIKDGSTDDSVSIANSVDATPAGPISLSMTAFTGGVNVSAITEIALTFFSEPGQQVSFSAPQGVPVAATLPLLLAGVVLLPMTRRRG